VTGARQSGEIEADATGRDGPQRVTMRKATLHLWSIGWQSGSSEQSFRSLPRAPFDDDANNDAMSNRL
jgi:hypothetical protein